MKDIKFNNVGMFILINFYHSAMIDFYFIYNFFAACYVFITKFRYIIKNPTYGFIFDIMNSFLTAEYYCIYVSHLCNGSETFDNLSMLCHEKYRWNVAVH